MNLTLSHISTTFPSPSPVCAAWNGLVFCVYGYSSDWTGTLFATSPDGNVWTTVHSDGLSWKNLIAVGTDFYAFETGGTIRKSIDNGVTWVTVTTGVSFLVRLIHTGTAFIYFDSSSGFAYRSTTCLDGSWTPYNMGYYPTAFVAYGNGIVCVLQSDGRSTIISTDDGITWNRYLNNLPDMLTCLDIAFGDGVFVLLVGGAGSGKKELYSVDCITWLFTSEANANDNEYSAVVWSGYSFVATGGLKTAFSPKGTLWRSTLTGDNIACMATDGRGTVLLFPLAPLGYGHPPPGFVVEGNDTPTQGDVGLVANATAGVESNLFKPPGISTCLAVVSDITTNCVWWLCSAGVFGLACELEILVPGNQIFIESPVNYTFEQLQTDKTFIITEV